MNAHANVTELPTQAWQFELGQIVSHKHHPHLSMVLLRTVTGRGREVYGIRRLRDDWDIMIMGDALVLVAYEEVEALALAEEKRWNA
ncbi:hypothetical protein [Mesorhizobium sp. M0276]|uniref:hypothetical protein n=1 Tax=Mesorhizobium sp. M0276 TaxID=2956928 RepID=UPI0033386B28